jgi:hypothetical protein
VVVSVAFLLPEACVVFIRMSAVFSETFAVEDNSVSGTIEDVVSVDMLAGVVVTEFVNVSLLAGLEIVEIAFSASSGDKFEVDPFDSSGILETLFSASASCVDVSELKGCTNKII